MGAEYPHRDAPIREIPVLGRLAGFTNPESCELLADGVHVLVSNAALEWGLPAFRHGQGVVARHREAYLSVARLSAAGLEMVEPRVVTGLTATYGIDVLPISTRLMPAGTALIAAGGRPITRHGSELVCDGPDFAPQLLAFDPGQGRLIAAIDLGPDSLVADRFNPIEQPNGLAVGEDGDVFFSDAPNANPTAPMPSPSPGAVYHIPVSQLDALIEGSPGAAVGVQRAVNSEGWANGVTCSKRDGGVFAVSCSRVDPISGGVYRLESADFAAESFPDPLHHHLGGEPRVLDGIGVTRRGTIIVSSPAIPYIGCIHPDSRLEVLVHHGGEPIVSPADVNVCYPPFLSGEPALLVPDVSARGGSHSVVVLDLKGL